MPFVKLSAAGPIVPTRSVSVRATSDQDGTLDTSSTVLEGQLTQLRLPRRSGASPSRRSGQPALSVHLSGSIKAQWKTLRTTNALECINGEIRRRTKTRAQSAWQNAVLPLRFRLLKSEHVRLRKIDGWGEMARTAAA